MKKKSILFYFLAVFLLSSSLQAQKFTVSLSVDGASGKVATLKQLVAGKALTLDSIDLDRSGKGKLSGEAAYPLMAYLVLDNDKSTRTPFFVEKGNMSVEATFSAHENKITHIKVKGSKTHDEFEDFNKGFAKYKTRMDTIIVRYRRAQATADSAKQAQVIAAYERLNEERTAYINEFISQNPKSFVSPHLIRTMLIHSLKLDELRQALEKLDASLAPSADYQYLKNRVEVLSKVAIGKPFVDFTQNDVEGNPVKVSDFKGSVLLIDFWAAWCRPCRKANPFVVEIYNDFHDKGFDILGVSFDSNRESWLNAIEKDKLTWAQVSELNGWKNSAGALYGVKAIPHTVLIDKHGKIVAKNLSHDELRDWVEKLTAEE